MNDVVAARGPTRGEQAARFREALRRDGFVVILFQPAQVRAYARFSRQLAKNDKIDAALIAACTAAPKPSMPLRTHVWRHLPAI